MQDFLLFQLKLFQWSTPINELIIVLILRVLRELLIVNLFTYSCDLFNSTTLFTFQCTFLPYT